jgi:hypothetical protein
MENPQDIWSNEVLDEIFRAMATSPQLSDTLIYKGAQVLRLRLGEPIRASFDIDASLAAITATFSTNPLEQQKFGEAIADIVAHHFSGQDPVRFELREQRLERRRKIGPHPRGWDVFELNLTVHDFLANPASVPPPLRIDLATPEEMSEHSVSKLDVGGYQVNAITLERIVGEKLRAFLSCLPAYRKKLGERKMPPRRVKDLYDLARIVRRCPLGDLAFWSIAGQEFKLACGSRAIDCAGLRTFHDGWNTTRSEYDVSQMIPADVPFDEVQSALKRVVRLLEDRKIIPFTFTL